MSEEENRNPRDAETPQTDAPEKIESEAPEDTESETPEEEKANSPSPLGGRSVFAYLAVLFGVAFLLLLFSYLMQQRDNQEITGTLSQLRESMGSIESIDQLVEENRQLREEKDGLQSRLDELEKQLDQLEAELTGEQNEVNRWRDINSESQATIDACCKVAKLKQLYEDGKIEEAKAFLDTIPESENMEGMDEVEYLVGNYVAKFISIEDPDLHESLLPYDPLEEWRALKEALAEEKEKD